MNLKKALLALIVALVCVSADAQAPTTRSVVLIPTTAITTAVTAIVGDTVQVPKGARNLTVRAQLVYGSGGTTAKAWVQTSLDGGTSWIDVMCFAFTTSSATKVSGVREDIALAAAYTPTDGSLADDTIKDGLLGDLVRVKWTTTG